MDWNEENERRRIEEELQRRLAEVDGRASFESLKAQEDVVISLWENAIREHPQVLLTPAGHGMSETVLHQMALAAAGRSHDFGGELAPKEWADILVRSIKVLEETVPREEVDHYLNASSPLGTPLHYVAYPEQGAEENALAVARELARAGANVGFKNAAESTPLHYAAKAPGEYYAQFKEALVEGLTERLQAQGVDRETALREAREVVAVLEKEPDMQGMTPQEIRQQAEIDLRGPQGPSL